MNSTNRTNRKSKPAGASGSLRWLCVAAMIAMSSTFVPASTVDGKVVAHNTPRYVAAAKNLGAEDPAKVIEVSIWLQMHNRSQFDALAESLYDSTSPNYRHWLKPAEIAASFGPTEEEAKTVRQFFTDHNLAVVKTGPRNFYVRARGTVGDVEKAFHVQLNNYLVRDKTLRANVGDPYIEGAAAPLVRAISGLDNGKFDHPLIVRQANLVGSQTNVMPAKPFTASSSDLFSSQCFIGTETETFSNNGDGEFPIGTYSGNKVNLASQTGAGCAYTPPVIQNAYHLTGLYNEQDEFDGTDQTIAIVDWCGSATIRADVKAFSKKFGLPQLNASKQHPLFGIIYTATSSCIDWDDPEINLDVEWAHAIAPGADINLVVPPSAEFQDVNQAEFDVVNDSLGTVLSGSYGSVEESTSMTELDTENLISEICAAAGISTNFSTGDIGDFTTEGYSQTVSAPADSPWATAVGGVSLALNPDNSIAWQAGWGTNWGAPDDIGMVTDPPGIFGFEFGSGGGASNCAVQDANDNCLGGFPKPSFQKNLPGKYRQLPDISWLADPTTGAAILISIPGVNPTQVWEVIGGTSLSTPMFSALWAIANQEANFSGQPPLGQAARYLYTMPAGAIYDVVPVASTHNVTASIQEPTHTKKYNASEVLGGGAPKDFVSAIWDDPYEALTLVVYSFGSDCAIALPSRLGDGTPCNTPQALKTKVGWDNVTGVGTPNAKTFADFFFGK